MVSKFIIGTFSIFVILIITSEVVSKATTGKPEQREVKKTPDIPGGKAKVGSRGLLDGDFVQDVLSIVQQEKDDEVPVNKVEEEKPKNLPPTTAIPAAPSTTTSAAPSTTTPAAPSTTTSAAPSSTTPAANPNEQNQKDLRELLSNIRTISDAFSKNIPIERPPNAGNPSTSNAFPSSLPQVMRLLSLISEIQKPLISCAITNCDKMETPPQAPFQLKNPNEISSEAAIQKVDLTSATANLSQLLAQLGQQKGGADEHIKIQLPPGLKPNPLVDSGNKGTLVTIGQQTNPDPNKVSVNNKLIEEKRKFRKELRSTLSKVKALLNKPKQ